MIKIKEYSSAYATKIAYILNDILNIKQNGLINDISEVTQEKESTTKNWLFNGRVPREPKRLFIADSLGISEEYLFDDSIDILDIKKPEIIKRDGCYWLPFVDDNEIFEIRHAPVFPIKKRIPLMLPAFEKLLQQYGKHIYATVIKESNFSPYIDDQATLICSEKIILEEYKFYLCQRNGKIFLKRLIISDGEKKFLIADGDQEIIEPIRNDEDMLLVVLALSY